MDLSIVIPAYNEEKRILTTLGETLEFLQKRSWSYELLAVDDGSADRTVACIEEYAHDHPDVRCVQNGRNCGKGYSVRRGMLAARGRYLLFSDAALSTPIAEVERLIANARSHVNAGQQ